VIPQGASSVSDRAGKATTSPIGAGEGATMTERDAKGQVYLVRNEHDPNDSFTFEACSPADAAVAALKELGWAVSAGPMSDEDEDDMKEGV
jgi:hypothetical protein